MIVILSGASAFVPFRRCFWVGGPGVEGPLLHEFPNLETRETRGTRRFDS
jgi:hypothetical protein